jgi:hypothetical protein
MLTLPYYDRRRSSVGAIKQWWREWITLNGYLAKPEGSDAPAERRKVVGFNDGAFDLLPMRMEALQLDPGEVRRIEPSVFVDLAKACANCESKDRCEQDLAYASAGTVTHDWDNYCSNAATLDAMRALPWFENQARDLQSERC